ncbi:hypothetical protein FF38_03620 [Lucilia cuprina]|uniref:Uncharacterized protein n=1 Tax=Lucilia cuprina TaxID=7375 RepID=A0A0L0CQI1_LUCCU|nr:hypothetical protein CVS40_0614 [Lucilia cuprina]KNC34427.1 hypothetical protein FF38_03620 [Lucilia cuprina]
MKTTKVIAFVLLITFIQIQTTYSDSQQNTENDASISDTKLKEIVVNITKKFDKRIIDNIIAQTVDELSSTRNLDELPDLFWSIYKKNDLERFDIMLRFQIQLYNSFSGRKSSNEKAFLQNYAYRLHKIKNEYLYSAVNMTLQSYINNIEYKLPENLKYLYFAPYFCLLNMKFQTYIYTAVDRKLDPFSRYIWMWFENQSMDDTGFIKANVLEYNSYYEKKFKVTLLGTKYQLYYYMKPDTHIIAGWDTVGSPSNHVWDIEFVDNYRVIFSQNDYLMCGVEPYDNERRNVGGRKRGEVSSSSTECQWRLGECLFK